MGWSAGIVIQAKFYDRSDTWKSGFFFRFPPPPPPSLFWFCSCIWNGEVNTTGTIMLQEDPATKTTGHQGINVVKTIGQEERDNLWNEVCSSEILYINFASSWEFLLIALQGLLQIQYKEEGVQRHRFNSLLHLREYLKCQAVELWAATHFTSYLPFHTTQHSFSDTFLSS